MKKSILASKELYASMLHFAVQLVVNALKERMVIDATYVYGLAIQPISSKLYRLSIDFTKTTNNTTLHELRIHTLPEAINIALSALLHHADVEYM